MVSARPLTRSSHATRQRPPAVFLMGPTASGKTALAMRLTRQFPFAVINVDAAQVYRGMDIGTAKPSLASRRAVPHRLIDIRDPHQSYSAAEFRRDALREMAAIVAHGCVPLLVGGTMFYFRVLESGIDALPGADPGLRQGLVDRARHAGWPALHSELAAADPVRAARIDPHDGQRIQRALEILELTGSTVGDVGALPDPVPFQIVKLAITPNDRRALHARIHGRFHEMLAGGLVDEVAGLMQRVELTPDLPALRTVGYRQVIEYLSHKVSYNQMTEQAVASTRQLAKRQLTWLRNQGGVVWFASPQVGRSNGQVEALIQYLTGRLADGVGRMPVESCHGKPH